MINKCARWGIYATVLIAAMAGCGGKPAAEADTPATVKSFALEGDTVGRIHWLGKKRLGINAGAYFFMRLWELPQSVALQSQTLDKLSSAPWRIGSAGAVPLNAPVSVLRSLLDDLVQEESYMEIRNPEGKAGDTAFAIRLEDARARAWQTNLAIVVESLVGAPTSPASDGMSWRVSPNRGTKMIQLTREGTWTLVSVGREPGPLTDELVRRIRDQGTPVPLEATNTWLEIEAKPARVVGAEWAELNLPTGIERIHFSVTGDGAALENSVEVGFAGPLNLSMEPWNEPTNLIYGPIASFTACRGFEPWLRGVASLTNWLEGAGSVPNQAYLWTGNQNPLQVCLAAPLQDARGVVDRLTDRLVGRGNEWLNANSGGSFKRLLNDSGATWAGLPMSAPYLMAPRSAPGWVVGGLVAPDDSAANRGAVPRQLEEILAQSNLVYYNWEYTAPRMSTSLYLAQLFRIVSKHQQLAMETRAATWVNALGPRLDNSTTTITMTASNQLKFVRHSTIGLTALELNLLAGWLESPEFPFGLSKLP